MKCPIDNEKLVLTERQGIEIDYCPDCRGIWLDRGELDKLVDRTDITGEQYTPKSDNEYRSDNYGKKKKREGFLGDLFDF